MSRSRRAQAVTHAPADHSATIGAGRSGPPDRADGTGRQVDAAHEALPQPIPQPFPVGEVLAARARRGPHLDRHDGTAAALQHEGDLVLTTTVTQVRQGDRHRAQGQQRANLGDDERLQQVAEDVSVEHDRALVHAQHRGTQGRVHHVHLGCLDQTVQPVVRT